MKQFVEQVKHNENFHTTLCTSFPNQFFDWKIICLFYSAYHLIQALAVLKKVSVGDRHKDILWNMNPRNPKRSLQVKKDIFEAQDELCLKTNIF
jgi:hypothetical protein